MSLPWFRFYHEVKDDPKMGALTDCEFRVFVEGMCWACESSDGGSTGLTTETVNWAFRRNVTETVSSLLQKQLLTLRGDGMICVTNWMKRQFQSDSSTERVRKHRQKRIETLQKRHCNGTEERRGEEKRRESTGPAHFPEAEIPSWEAFWSYCQSQACLLPAEWYARDKFEAANQDHWRGKANWQAYARRCKGWWESDGRPMIKPLKTPAGRPVLDPRRPCGGNF